MVLKRRSHKQEEATPTTRFDAWSTEDLLGVLETQLMGLTGHLDAFRRCDQQQKAQTISLMLTKLQTAEQATFALRRKVANGKRI